MRKHKKKIEADKRRARYKSSDIAHQADMLAKRARADNTARTYQCAQRQYLAWCQKHGHDPLPGTPEQVAQYLAFLAIERGHPPVTVRNKFAAIRRYYRDHVGIDNVTRSEYVRNVVSGIQRDLATQAERAAALTIDLIREIVGAMEFPEGKRGLQARRDRALLLVGYAGAFRRSELASLRTADLEFFEGGAVLFLRSSKTDQVQAGQSIGIGEGTGATCPVAALRDWLDNAPAGDFLLRPVDRWGNVDNKPLTHHGVNQIVKRLAQSIGLDTTEYSAHSLRAGITTDLTAQGLSIAQIQARTRHQSPAMVQHYNRPASALAVNYSRHAGM